VNIKLIPIRNIRSTPAAVNLQGLRVSTRKQNFDALLVKSLDYEPTDAIVLSPPLITACIAIWEIINTMKSKKNGGFPDRGLDSQALHLLGDLMEKDAEGTRCQDEEISKYTSHSKVS
jgi:hypothetical protein